MAPAYPADPHGGTPVAGSSPAVFLCPPRAIHSAGMKAFRRELDSGEFPCVRELLSDDLDAGVAVVRELFREDGRFECGLERLLDGIEASFEAQPGA